MHGLEIVHAAKPTSYAPSIERKDGPIKAQITARDPLAIELQARARRAFAYLQCFFDVEIDADRLTSTYEAETPEEDDHIDIKGYKFEKSEQPLSLTYDYVVRSLWATDEDADPEFVAKLAATARRAFFEEEYISSFRYSFLLIESLYGRGKFQSYQLKKELSENAQFRLMVEKELTNFTALKLKRPSDLQNKIREGLSIDGVIDILVERRGFYFHGNILRKDAWRPDKQEEAEGLCLFSLGIVHDIGAQTAAPMFLPKYAQRYQDEAFRSGAKVALKVDYTFQTPPDKLQRRALLNMNYPGTKATNHMSVDAAKNFLEFLPENTQRPT